jgi:hypothetical protein
MTCLVGLSDSGMSAKPEGAKVQTLARRVLPCLSLLLSARLLPSGSPRTASNWLRQ